MNSTHYCIEMPVSTILYVALTVQDHVDSGNSTSVSLLHHLAMKVSYSCTVSL